MIDLIKDVIEEVKKNVEEQQKVGWAGMVRKAGKVVLIMGLVVLFLALVALVVPAKADDTAAKLEKRNILSLVMLIAGSYLTLSGAALRYEAHLGLGIGSFCVVLLLGSWTVKIFRNPDSLSESVFRQFFFVLLFGLIGIGVQIWRISQQGRGRAFLAGFTVGGLLYLVIMLIFVIVFAPRVRRNREELEREKQKSTAEVGLIVQAKSALTAPAARNRGRTAV